MKGGAEALKSLTLVAGAVAVWALAVGRSLAAVSPDYAAREPGAGLVRPGAWLAAGLIVSLLTTAAARLGRGTPRPTRSLVAPSAFTLALATGFVVVGTVAGAMLAAHKAVTLPPELAAQVPARRHGAFVAAAGGHLASGALFPVAGVQAAAVWLSRRTPRRLVMHPKS